MGIWKKCGLSRRKLTHGGSQLISWLKEYGLLDHVLVLDVVANEHDRIERNSNRPGHIPTGEFAKYFPEEGHLLPMTSAHLRTGTSESIILGQLVKPIHNFWKKFD